MPMLQGEETTVAQARGPSALSGSHPGFPPCQVKFLLDFVFQGWELWPGPQNLLKPCATPGPQLRIIGLGVEPSVL